MGPRNQMASLGFALMRIDSNFILHKQFFRQENIIIISAWGQFASLSEVLIQVTMCESPQNCGNAPRTLVRSATEIADIEYY